MRLDDARSLRVGIDARLRSGAVGGVEQYVLGLIHTLTRFPDGDERYLVLVEPDDSAWIRPHVGPRGHIVESQAPAQRSGRAVAFRRAVARTIPGARSAWRRAGITLGRVSIPQSDGSLERAGAELIHFPKQDAFTTNLPSVYQPWDLQHEHLPLLFSPHARRWRDATYREFSRRADVVVTASRWVREDVLVRYGVDADRVAVINVPPPVDLYPNPDADALLALRSRYSLPPRYLIYPAHTWPHKNHLALLQALSRVRASTDVTLVCTGGITEHHREIARAVQRHALAEAVRFLGYVPSTDLRGIFQMADGLVFPSLFEGWGFPIVEAFRLGVPVACSNVTSLPELVGDAALVFDPLDVAAMERAIETLWTRESVRDELRARGHARVAGLDWNTTGRRVRALYRSILRPPLSRPDRTLLEGPLLA